MIFNILLVLLVTCFATVTTPSTMLASKSDVVIENAAHADDNNNDDVAPGMPEDDVDMPDGDKDDGVDDEEDEGSQLVSYEPTEHSFSFDSDHDDNESDA